jgi:selenocysteine lyase/cysteine desulfurase
MAVDVRRAAPLHAFMTPSAHQTGREAALHAPIDLPASTLFQPAGVYMDSAYFHPLSRGAQAAVQDYLDFKAAGGLGAAFDVEAMQEGVRADFARLVGAAPDDISFVPSTTTAENLIVSACGLTTRGRIVTDRLHFFGSLHLYESLRARGVDVVILEPRDERIRLEDLAQALEQPTDLVALSAVSRSNGFAPDMAQVCALAHSRDALVYVDAIQAIGAVPFDLAALGVDFCGCGAYKWLMGDMGLAFLYVRADRRAALRQPQFGARQVAPTTGAVRSTGASFFEVGTIANACVAALSFSLPWLWRVGASAIANHRLALLEQIEDGLGRYGLAPELPATSASPILVYKHPRSEALSKALKAANMYATVYPDSVRFSPSVFNTPSDVAALVDVVGASL